MQEEENVRAQMGADQLEKSVGLNPARLFSSGLLKRASRALLADIYPFTGFSLRDTTTIF